MDKEERGEGKFNISGVGDTSHIPILLRGKNNLQLNSRMLKKTTYVCKQVGHHSMFHSPDRK